MSDEQQPEAPEAGGEAGPEPATEPAGQVPGVPEPVPEPADSVVAVPDAQDPGAAAVPKAAPKKKGRPPGSKNKPKPPPQTVPAESADPAPGNARAQAARAPDARADAEGAADQPAEPLRAAGRGVQHGRVSKATMMPLERRKEPQMLRSFWKQYPSYRVQPLLYKRYNELLEARALNEWLENRRIRKEGEEYTDAVGRLTDTVNRRLPQLRYAPAERAGVRRAARDVARDGTLRSRQSWAACSKESMEERRQYGFRVRPNYGQVLGYIQEGEPIGLELPKRNASVYMASHFYLDDFPQSSEAPTSTPRRPSRPTTRATAGSPSLGRPGRCCGSAASSRTAAATSEAWTPHRRCAWTASTRRSRQPSPVRESGIQAAETAIAGLGLGARQYAEGAAIRGLGRGEQWLDRTLRIPRTPDGLAPPPDEVAPPQIIGRPSEVLLERAGQRAALQEARAIQDIEAFTQGQMAEAEAAEGFASAAWRALNRLGHRGRPHLRQPPHGLLGSGAVDIQTLNGMQESGVQQHFAMHQSQRQRPEVIRIDTDSDSAPRAQPAPRVRARAARQQPSPFGVNPIPLPRPQGQSSGSEGSRISRQSRSDRGPLGAEPSFDQLRSDLELA